MDATAGLGVAADRWGDRMMGSGCPDPRPTICKRARTIGPLGFLSLFGPRLGNATSMTRHVGTFMSRQPVDAIRGGPPLPSPPAPPSSPHQHGRRQRQVGADGRERVAHGQVDVDVLRVHRDEPLAHTLVGAVGGGREGQLVELWRGLGGEGGQLRDKDRGPIALTLRGGAKVGNDGTSAAHRWVSVSPPPPPPGGKVKSAGQSTLVRRLRPNWTPPRAPFGTAHVSPRGGPRKPRGGPRKPRM